MKNIFEAIVPGWKGRTMPESFPFHIRLLLWLSVIIAHLAAIFKHGKTFGRLSREKQVKLMENLYNHPSSAVRSIVQWWKLTALMLQC